MCLPIELVERIIDTACCHPPTLAACSLVCKDWLPRSRHHLFALLDLSAHWNPEPNAVTEFMKIITAPNSTLVPYVTAVVLGKRSWGMTPVQRILATLARSGIRPGFLHINCPTYEPTHLPIFSVSLVHLTLYLHNDMPIATLVDHVCAFPLLESLYVGGSARYTADVYPATQSLPPKLRTLVISNPVFAHWVLSLDPVPTQISTIILRYINLPEQWDEINRYLASPAAAAGIHSLTFEECDVTYPQIPYIPPDLQHLENLHTLIIEKSGTLLADCLLGVLAAVRSSPATATLETIELYAVNGSGPGEFPHMRLREADGILADAAKLPGLQRVVVVMRIRTLTHPDFPVDHKIPPEIVSRLLEAMPLCDGRRLLFLR
ncbi:hypothetical protein B0H17DRAFT_1130590 [Mycena rosella]|uniref:F-box domain-containing protein n=1 Tax=Mycena rosella TaxID=1033263 RepID=A0AAD7GLS1_MYCRO|nr:hypothetical protein B0H17DRAFT_1130590 [Mycena rosella]